MKTFCEASRISLVLLSNSLKRIILLIILALHVHANSRVILKATSDGLSTPDASLYMRNSAGKLTPLDYPRTCITKKIQNRWAFPISCLKNLDTISFKGVTGHGIKLTYWRDRKDPDAEYVLAYSSVSARQTDLKIFHITEQPRQTWVDQKLFLHGLNDYPSVEKFFEFTNSSRAIRNYETDLFDIGSPGLSNYTDSDRFNLKPFNALDRFAEHRLLNNHTLWIHEIKTFNAPQPAHKEYLKQVQIKCQTFLENSDSPLAKVIILISILSLLLALLMVTRYLRLQLLSSLIMPTTLVVIFMAEPTAEYFKSLEGIHLQKIQKEIESVYQNIKQTEEVAKRSIHNRVLKNIPKIREELNLINFDSGIPSELKLLDPQGGNILSMSSADLRNAILDLEQKMIQSLTSSKDNFFQTRLAAQQPLLNSINLDKLSTPQLRILFVQLAQKCIRIVEIIRKVEIETGVSLSLSNLKCTIESNKILEKFVSQNGFETPLGIQILRNASRTANQTAMTDSTKREASLLIQERLSEVNIDPQFITNYLNNSYDWHQITNHRRWTDNHTINSWQLIEANNGPWALFMVMRLTTLIREMNHLIKNQKLNELGSQLNFDYYFQTEKNRESFPIVHQNSFLSEAANLAKINGAPILVSEIKNDRHYVAMGFPLPQSSIYSLAIGREITEDWNKLVKFKYWIQLLIVMLILAPLFLAATMAGVITRPLKQLKTAVYQIAGGTYETRIEVDSLDEFSNLANQFNQMAVSLQQGQELTSFISDESRDTILASKQQTFRENVSILFCGIHNISMFHELKLEESRIAFEQFVITCQKIIKNHSGIVDKFTGVALLAVFRGSQCANQALNAADEIKRILIEINQSKTTPYHVGIGIASGPIILGQVGAVKRKDFTCIGNTVNMAARLETLSRNSKAAVTTYLDDSTLSAIKELEPTVKDIPPTRIKGKKELQKVYELVSL